MPQSRIGVDLLPISRVEAMAKTQPCPVLERMLSATELELSSISDGWDITGIAGRLAGKEAVFKLIHTHGHSLPWRSIEILKTDRYGGPFVRLTGIAATLAARAGIADIDISITHDDSYAIAVAVGGTEKLDTEESI